MNENPTCYRCDEPMRIGFLGDAAHSSLLQARWCEGEPQAGFLTEVKARQFRAGLKTFSYRCPKCGLLETYAFDKE